MGTTHSSWAWPTEGGQVGGPSPLAGRGTSHGIGGQHQARGQPDVALPPHTSPWGLPLGLPPPPRPGHSPGKPCLGRPACPRLCPLTLDGEAGEAPVPHHVAEERGVTALRTAGPTRPGPTQTLWRQRGLCPRRKTEPRRAFPPGPGPRAPLPRYPLRPLRPTAQSEASGRGPAQPWPSCSPRARPGPRPAHTTNRHGQRQSESRRPACISEAVPCCCVASAARP